MRTVTDFKGVVVETLNPNFTMNLLILKHFNNIIFDIPIDLQDFARYKYSVT